MKPKRKTQIKISSERKKERSGIAARLRNISMQAILDSCVDNEISPAIALLKLVFASRDPTHLGAVVKLVLETATIQNNAALTETCALYEENRAACERIMTMPQPEPMTDLMTSDERIAWLRESFDRWVEEDAALSVALYTFGNPRLVSQTAMEIVSVLDGWGLLGPAVDALQIGCGTGRIEGFLSPRVHLAWGIDISAKMIKAAQQKLVGFDNVRLSECSGRDLDLFGMNSFDLVYAVDSFPYIVEAGAELVDRHFAEVARVLRDGGHFVIFQYSYRGDTVRDRDDVRRLATAHGYRVIREEMRPFTVWDGVGYHLRKSLS